MTFGDPVCTLSSKAVKLIAEIAAALERYKIAMEGPGGVRLRKLNHIRTLRGTTAIEGNTLTEAEITAILAGKRVSEGKKTRPQWWGWSGGVDARGFGILGGK